MKKGLGKIASNTLFLFTTLLSLFSINKEINALCLPQFYSINEDNETVETVGNNYNEIIEWSNKQFASTDSDFVEKIAELDTTNDYIQTFGSIKQINDGIKLMRSRKYKNGKFIFTDTFLINYENDNDVSETYEIVILTEHNKNSFKVLQTETERITIIEERYFDMLGNGKVHKTLYSDKNMNNKKDEGPIRIIECWEDTDGDWNPDNYTVNGIEGYLTDSDGDGEPDIGMIEKKYNNNKVDKLYVILSELEGAVCHGLEFTPTFIE